MSETTKYLMAAVLGGVIVYGLTVGVPAMKAGREAGGEELKAKANIPASVPSPPALPISPIKRAEGTWAGTPGGRKQFTIYATGEDTGTKTQYGYSGAVAFTMNIRSTGPDMMQYYSDDLGEFNYRVRVDGDRLTLTFLGSTDPTQNAGSVETFYRVPTNQ